MTVSTIAVAIVSMPTKKNGMPKANSTATSSATPPENARHAVSGNDVQLPEDAEETEHREHDDETVGEAGVDVASEEERERADADEAGDAVQRLHLDQQSEHAEREQQPADDRIGRKARDCSAQRERLGRARGASARCELRQRRIERRRRSSRRCPRARASSVLSVRIAPARLYCGRSTLLSTIAPASCRVAVIALRGRFELAAQRRRCVLHRAPGSARRRRSSAPGAITMRSARQRDERGGGVGALRRRRRSTGSCAEKSASRISKCRVDEAAGAIDVEHDRARRASLIRFGDGTLDEMRHAVVDGAGDRDDDDRAVERLAGRRGPPAPQRSRPRPDPGRSRQSLHAACYLRRGGRRLRR